jgi:TolB-like protein
MRSLVAAGVAGLLLLAAPPLSAPAAADSRPADSRAADSRTADSRTADSPVADPSTVDSHVADSRTADSGTANSRTADPNFVDSRTAESHVADSRTADSRTADSRTADAPAAVAHRGAAPVIAVMPFRDLSAARAPVGEALRETVTADLKGVPGVRVVERAAIDRVVAEQKLDDKKRDLDAIASVRVGTLIGASLIVAGAYQRVGGDVRLTARIIDVATGELRGSAKVDGAADELLRLQDALAASLFKSAGLPAPAVQRFVARARPKVPYRAFELYGDAVTAADESERRKLLQQAIAAAPQLSYAVRDLAALQERMDAYSVAANQKFSEREQLLLSRADDHHRPNVDRAQAARQLLTELMAARRFHTLASVVLRPTYGKLDGLAEPAAYARFVALSGLRDWENALRAGEAYLRALPTGEHYREIESRMHDIVETRKKREARRAEYAADLAEKRGSMPRDAAHQLEWDWAPCIAARWNSQVNELMLDGCSAFAARYRDDARPEAREHVLAARMFVILALAERGDFARARPMAEALMRDSDTWDEELRKAMSEWPTD